ncbi:hypothetical protein ColTof4_09424 [Colletotrichum tofieldiae]|uniref:Uncharacterized protein n=1 Tax=Colletotrichum liriopes TaxID=708192 RepID=A0AA37GJP6_9PEZI|nr:hypothetical protein ColLi_05114 [Colletotrichum liriopes]GKT77001.1 hypothetical protein ColTof4_09424 [Colletotrichum tofieldiae]GKT86627.1 hypothetical protein Ct61P_04477 [Colletotrichum tofieldiae]
MMQQKHRRSGGVWVPALALAAAAAAPAPVRRAPHAPSIAAAIVLGWKEEDAVTTCLKLIET